MPASAIGITGPVGGTARPLIDPREIECRSIARGRLRLKMSARARAAVLRAADALTAPHSGTSIAANDILGTVLFEYDPRRYSERPFLSTLFEHWRFGPSEIEVVVGSFPPQALARLAPDPTSVLGPHQIDQWSLSSARTVCTAFRCRWKGRRCGSRYQARQWDWRSGPCSSRH